VPTLNHPNPLHPESVLAETNQSSQHRWHGFFIFVVALITRGLYYFQYQNNPFFNQYGDSAESRHFDLGAQSFANGDWLATAPDYVFAPLYKYFLGAIYWVAGRDLQTVWGVQFFMGALTVLLIFLICKHQFNARTAWIAGLVYNFHGPVLMYEGVILRASLISFLGVASLYALIRLPQEPSFLRLILTALPVALFVQCCPNVLLAFVFILIFYRRWLRKEYLKIPKRLALLVFLFCLPALVQSSFVHGKPVLFEGTELALLLPGHSIESTGWLDSLKESGYLFSQKVYFFFSSFQLEDSYDFKSFQDYSFLLKTPLSNFGLLSALGLFGFALGMQEFHRHRLLYAYSVGTSLAVLLIFISARYRIPVIPFFAIWAGFALDRLATWHESKKYYKSVAVVVFIAALFTFLNSQNLIPASITGP
jgi:4-amino-4-deoxy-L-arabinose transferase-like glycosyltransferase